MTAFKDTLTYVKNNATKNIGGIAKRATKGLLRETFGDAYSYAMSGASFVSDVKKFYEKQKKLYEKSKNITKDVDKTISNIKETEKQLEELLKEKISMTSRIEVINITLEKENNKPIKEVALIDSLINEKENIFNELKALSLREEEIELVLKKQNSTLKVYESNRLKVLEEMIFEEKPEKDDDKKKAEEPQEETEEQEQSVEQQVVEQVVRQEEQPKEELKKKEETEKQKSVTPAKKSRANDKDEKTTILDSIEKLGKGIKTGFNTMKTGFKNLFGKFVQYIATMIPALIAKISVVFTTIMSTFMAMLPIILGVIGAILVGIAAWVIGYFLLKKPLEWLINAVFDLIDWAIGLWYKIKNIIGNLLSTISSMFEQLVIMIKEIPNIFFPIVNHIKDTIIYHLTNTINVVIGGLSNLEIFGKKPLGFLEKYILEPKPPPPNVFEVLQKASPKFFNALVKYGQLTGNFFDNMNANSYVFEKKIRGIDGGMPSQPPPIKLPNQIQNNDKVIESEVAQPQETEVKTNNNSDSSVTVVDATSVSSVETSSAVLDVSKIKEKSDVELINQNTSQEIELLRNEINNNNKNNTDNKKETVVNNNYRETITTVKVDKNTILGEYS